MNKYTWRMKSLAKGIDPDLAIAEIERIENVYGSLTAETVLEASKDESALLHPLFQWDDSVAATQYRLSQARNIINNIEIVIISDGEPRTMPVYEIVNIGEGRIYKSVTEMNREDIDFVKASVKREINSLKLKLSNFSSLNKVVDHLDNAIKEL